MIKFDGQTFENESEIQAYKNLMKTLGMDDFLDEEIELIEDASESDETEYRINLLNSNKNVVFEDESCDYLYESESELEFN